MQLKGVGKACFRVFFNNGFTQRFFFLISISFSIAFFFYQFSNWFLMIYHRKTQLRYIGPKCKAWQIDMVSLKLMLQSSFWSSYFHFSSITVLTLGKFYFDSKLYFFYFYVSNFREKRKSCWKIMKEKVLSVGGWDSSQKFFCS